ncbi:MAG: diguanylate cyclase, partial [Methylococcaceae bacterium]|nr:diguanylate cyclase [Methylococcaceae bacterium]
LFAMAFFNAPEMELRYQPSLVIASILFPIIRLRAFRDFFELSERKLFLIILPLCFGLSLQLLPLLLPIRAVYYCALVLPDILLNIYLCQLIMRKGKETALFGHSFAAFALSLILLNEITLLVLIALEKEMDVFPNFMIIILGVLEATSMLIMAFGRLIGQLISTNEQLHELAIKDSLTGLLNRRAFTEQGNVILAARQRNNTPVAVMMMDIDWFKKVNDNYGHAGGDEALRCLSHLLKTQARTPDVIGRLGGEEFGIVMPDTDMTGAMNSAERLRNQIEKLEVVTDNATFKMSASIGVDILRPDDTDLFSLLARADEALYAAKTAGRNRVVNFDHIQ